MAFIKGNLSSNSTVLEDRKINNWCPFISAVLKNVKSPKPSPANETKLAEYFLIDTGASMTILHKGLSYLFVDTPHIDKLKMFYGDGKERMLKVYDVIIRIKGVDFKILAALDNNSHCNYSILGITKGMDIFGHTVFNFQKKNYLITYK